MTLTKQAKAASVKSEQKQNTDLEKVTQTQSTIERIVGTVTMLMMQSAMHRHVFVSDYDWIAIPPILLKQYRVFRDSKRRPIGFATWATLSDEAEKRLIAHGGRLSAADWASGDKVYLMDVIAPYGGQQKILKALIETEFQGKDLYTVRPSEKPGEVKSVLVRDVMDKESVPAVEESN